MNAPAPGWLPDPTGRHDYRYWDGVQWSDDVSDGGVTSVDPFAAASAPQTPSPDFGAGAYGGPPPAYTSGPYGAAPKPGGGGPSTGLLVGLGALLVVLVVGVIVVLTNQDDDDPSTETTSNTTEADGDDTTTTADDSDSDNSDDVGGDEVDQSVIDGIAAGIYESGNGIYTEEEADCIAQAMVDEIGLDRLMEIGLSAIEEGEGDPSTVDPFEVLSEDEISAVAGAMTDCVDFSDGGTDG